MCVCEKDRVRQKERKRGEGRLDLSYCARRHIDAHIDRHRGEGAAGPSDVGWVLLLKYNDWHSIGYCVTGMLEAWGIFDASHPNSVWLYCLN